MLENKIQSRVYILAYSDHRHVLIDDEFVSGNREYCQYNRRIVFKSTAGGFQRRQLHSRYVCEIYVEI